MELGDTIVKGNTATSHMKAKAMIFLRHHLDEGLKSEYLTVEDPADLWDSLKERFDHLKMVILPKARFDWLNLRLQDFKTVSEYNSAMFRITSQLKLCGEKVTDEQMLEKTFTTFHASNLLLQQQYREKGFKKYSELIVCLLLAEQNNELLLKAHDSRPTGSSPFPEANATQSSRSYRGPERGRGRGRGRGRAQNYNRGRYEPYNTSQNHGKRQEEKDKCHRCGMEGHWSRTCRTAEHLVKLYQASLKGKGKVIETNFIDNDDDIDDVDLSFLSAPEAAYNNDDNADMLFLSISEVTNSFENID